jgi:hypothetical protein
VWMSIPEWFHLPAALRSPFHANLAIVFGTLTIFFAGLAVSKIAQNR